MGNFARPDKPPGEPLPENVAHNATGFTKMDGTADTLLETFGDITDLRDADEFYDECPASDLIIGYQITYSSGSGILQIRFLCSAPSSSSACGVLLCSPDITSFTEGQEGQEECLQKMNYW